MLAHKSPAALQQSTEIIQLKCVISTNNQKPKAPLLITMLESESLFDLKVFVSRILMLNVIKIKIVSPPTGTYSNFSVIDEVKSLKSLGIKNGDHIHLTKVS